MQFSNEQKNDNPSQSDYTSQLNSENIKLKRNSQRKRKRRTKAELRMLRMTDVTVDEFVQAYGNNYFRLSEEQAKMKVIQCFRRQVHIKEILGRERNLFNLTEKGDSIANARDYIRLVKYTKKWKLKMLKLRDQQSMMTVGCLVPRNQSENRNSTQILNSEDFQLIKKRQDVSNQVEQFFSESTQNQESIRIDPLTKQLLTLCKLNFQYEKELISGIETMASEDQGLLQNLDQQTNQESIRLQNDYKTTLVRKNMMLAFKEEPINLMNYFRQREIDQKEAYDDSELLPIQSFASFKKYLKQKKPKKGKADRQSLKTICACCFSNYCQIYNLMERCLECGVRVHQLCHNMTSTCSRCKYNRKTKEQKEDIPYCFICNRKKQHGIALEIIKDEKKFSYAHSFCLLVHNLWRFENGKINYFSGSKQELTDRCALCGGQGICFTTDCCGLKVHGLCSFLQGYSMSLTQNGDVMSRCCRDGALKQKLAFQRKFRLNFGNILYRQQGKEVAFMESH